MKHTNLLLLLILSILLSNCKSQSEKMADKPLFRDPVYDGAADPVVIWNEPEQKWFMYYTNRRANILEGKGVEWVHGTRIGIAESTNGGASWTYRDTCNIDYRIAEGYTHWAPEVISNEGLFHMYLTYVPGVFADWKHPRWIVHLTSKNGIDWNFQSRLKLASEKVIDACVFKMPDGSWRMWYNNEMDGKTMYYADSPDLFNWVEKGKAGGSFRGEGPKVFYWKEKWWMVTDAWKGLAVYQSDDLVKWNRQAKNILEIPGTGLDDQVKGGHADVVVQGKAYVFYFTHPGRRDLIPESEVVEKRRSSIQVTELFLSNGEIWCNRNQEVQINMKK